MLLDRPLQIVHSCCCLLQ